MEISLNNKRITKIVYETNDNEAIAINCKDGEITSIEKLDTTIACKDYDKMLKLDVDEKMAKTLNESLERAKGIIELDKKGGLDKFVPQTENDFKKILTESNSDEMQVEIDICLRSMEQLSKKIMNILMLGKIEHNDKHFWELVEKFQLYHETLQCLKKNDMAKIRNTLWKNY